MSLTPEQRLAACRQHLETFYGYADGGYAVLWTKSDSKSRCYAATDAAALERMAQDAIRLSNTQNVYYNVNLIEAPVPENERGDGEKVIAVPALYADIDVDPSNPKKPKSRREATDFLGSLDLAPSVIVSSGRGVHPYWILKEPFPIESADHREEIRSFLQLWELYVHRKAAERGWEFDSVGDLARILRLPGTINHKEGGPFPVETIHEHAARYNLSDFDELLPEDIADGTDIEVPDVGKTRITDRLHVRLEKVVTQFWGDGRRHNAARAVSGWLANNGIAQRDTVALIKACSEAAGDRDTKEKIKTANDAYKRLQSGRRPIGWAELRQMTTPKQRLELDKIMRALRKDQTDETPQEPPPAEARKLADFASYVNDKLNKRAERREKREVSDLLVRFLHDENRLLVDGDETPYVVADNGAVVPVVDKERSLRTSLSVSGISPTEPAYAWFVADLQRAAATGNARPVHLKRWTAIVNGALYMSCGPTSLVRVRPGEPPELLPNGTDDVLFASTASLPAWDPAATPVDPLERVCMQPPLIAPLEAPAYTPAVQVLLFRAWLISIVLSVQPSMILTASGQKGAGKSTLVRSVVKLIKGSDSDLTDANLDARDFAALVTGSPLVALDNMDTEPPPWLQDAMANAATGGMITRRELFTNATIDQRQITATMAVTTRTASFAARPDIQERVLPLFTGRPHTRRSPDRVLMGELTAVRDGCLAYLATAAANAIPALDNAPADLPSRFVDFARITWSLDPDNAGLALYALERAQLLAITDPDPLLAAIVAHVGEGLRYGPTDLIRELTKRGATIPFLGGGKAISARIRELKDTLRIIGIRVEERTDAGGHLTFWIYRFRLDLITEPTAENAENADSTNPTREDGNFTNTTVNGNGFTKPAFSADSASRQEADRGRV